MIEVLIVLIMTALATATLGVFLLLKKEVMTTDALSHTIILGIVLAFFLTEDTRSPLLILGASLVGVLTVVLIQWLQNIKLIKGDAAIGIVFTALFALAVILISRFLDHIHLDLDIVLVGEVLFAPFNRMELFGYSIPVAVVQLGIMAVINLLFVVVFYQALKITTFDQIFARSIGIFTVLIYYALMVLVSVTAVTAFDAVGAILVISFFVAPAATAYLLADRLSHVIMLSLGVAVLNSIVGFFIGYYSDLTISGTTASVAFVTFTIAFLFNKDGFISKRVRRKEMHSDLLQLMMLKHIESVGDIVKEDMYTHFNQSQRMLDDAFQSLQKRNLITSTADKMRITDDGVRLIQAKQVEFGLTTRGVES